MFNPKLLFVAPEINPINKKARSIPVLNPINMYGRVINFAWIGFFMAFWSWYAFPPLLSVTIKKDLKMTTPQVLNSNITGLCGTLIIRWIAGPLCDRFGPRYVFAGILLAGAIPTALAGAVTTPNGVIALRFFIGILGGSFVPCQVWTTGFYDKNIIGTANSFTGGWGNAGGGITYFAMPAIFDSLVHKQHLKPHVAWRVSFIVPFILIVAVAIGMLVTCPDTPTGKWSERHLHVQENLHSHGIVDVPGTIGEGEKKNSGISSPAASDHKLDDSKLEAHEGQIGEQEAIATAEGEVIKKPTLKEFIMVFTSIHSLALALPYFVSFGAELGINGILGAYYLKNFKKLGQTGTGNWAAMFGLLNIVCRPLGGIVADYIYRVTHSVRAKRTWVHVCGIIQGAFLLAIGLTDPHEKSKMFGLVAGMAVFLEAGNGANFSVVPHVHPFANGILSGFVGGVGNLGGIICAIIFRYHGTDYHKSFWIIGILAIAVNLAVCWIPIFPKSQIGGR